MRVLEAVPGRIESRIGEPVRAAQVDDDGAVRRLERGGALVIEAAEDELRACGERLVVRNEVGHVRAEPRIERRGRLSRERVGSERDELELRVCEHAVERLLARSSRTHQGSPWRTSAYYAQTLGSMRP